MVGLIREGGMDKWMDGGTHTHIYMYLYIGIPADRARIVEHSVVS